MAPDNKTSKNKAALLIGFALILVVAITTFSRSSNNKDEESDANTDTIEEEKNYQLISVDELTKKIRNDESIKIIDIRSVDEYEAEHIIDSKNIPISKIDSKELNDPNVSVVVLVGRNDDSYAEVFRKINQDSDDIVALSGGFYNWKNELGRTISFGSPESFVNQARVDYITSENAKKLIDSDAQILILYVGSSKSFSRGHIDKSINIPLKELEERRKEISVSDEIIVYGETELEGFQAAVRLYELNFFLTSAMQGGISAWKEKGYEIVQ